jgi:hypothetical protein
MSDSRISIVPRKSTYPGKENKAKDILAWLISLDIVKTTLSDCILSTQYGYAISQGAKKIVTHPDLLPFQLRTNGLEIITERTIFDTGENEIEKLICPKCEKDISGEDWDFLNEWFGKKSDRLTCPSCNAATEVHDYQFVPEWGFSDLGFTFWNWPPLKDEFINEFKEKLECDVSVVYQHI